MDNDKLIEFLDCAARQKWRKLDLSGRGLTQLPPDIGNLPQLQFLNLEFNQLVTLPWDIRRLSQLQYLNLKSNRLTALPWDIGRLRELEELQLEDNDLTSVPPEIGLLSQLRCLNLRDNRLGSLPTKIGDLTKLRELDLSGNRLIRLPSEIGTLSQLQRLNLSGNRLEFLPPDIGRLSHLRELDLSSNQLTALPAEISRLSQLESLRLHNNPLPELPPEILTRTGDPQAIINTYLDFLSGQRRPLNEIKMVLVGQGGVGKTSLVTCILDGPEAFDPHEGKTEGISIRRWQPSIPDGLFPQGTEERQIRVNVWDFGGQEIMHATHQFFLTHRTLYLLVLNARLSEADNRLDYWLQIIRSFGGDSPVILVGNKVDQQPLDIDRGGLKKKYPFIRAIVETSCFTGKGIDTLQATIVEQIPTLPHLFDELLATWFDVKAELEELDVDYIPYTQYVQMCQRSQVTNEQSQRILLGFLHDLGIVLHFPDPLLEATNILNPEWVTQGVYRILNSHALFQNDGVLTSELLTQILNSPEYPRDKHYFIVDMMRKFELCYPFPGRRHAYLVPDLLPKEEQYTGDWDNAVAFQVHYNVLPSSIFSRFIVRMHRYIHQRAVWRTGVLLSCEGNQALVKADLADNCIHIYVRGPIVGRRDLLTRIREQLDAIHHTIRGLQTEERVPLPDHPELPPVDYNWLKDMEQKGIPEFLAPGLTEPISVGKLLNGIEPQSARRDRDSEQSSRNIYASHIGQIGDVITQPDERSEQMDPVTGAFVAALAAGVLGGVTEVGKKTMVDTYEALKAAIKRKYGEESKIAQAISAVEDEPDFEPNQQALAGRVEQVDADEDPELEELAHKLLEALEETSQGKEALSKYNIQIEGGQVGVIGDHTEVKGGMHFGSSKE